MSATRLEVGGKEYELRLDLNVIAEIGDRVGLKIRLAHLDEDLLEAPLPLSAARTILWIALKQTDSSLTENEVGAMVGLGDGLKPLGDVVQAFFSLFGVTGFDPSALLPEEMGEGADDEQPTTKP